MNRLTSMCSAKLLGEILARSGLTRGMSTLAKPSPDPRALRVNSDARHGDVAGVLVASTAVLVACDERCSQPISQWP